VWGATTLGGIGDVVAVSALRLFACTGLLTTGISMAGASAGIAVADAGDSAGGRTDGAPVTSKVEGGSEGASNATKPDPPTSTVGSGRDDIDVKSADEQNKQNGFPTGSKKLKDPVTVPIPRIPRTDELPASRLPEPCLFYTTLVKPLQTLADVFAAMQPQPEPSPAPGPAFRMQEEGPPVADSGGGGVDAVSTGVAAEPPVLQAPLVIAPRPMQLPPAAAPVEHPGAPAGEPAAPVAHPGAPAGASPPPVVAVDAVAVDAPVIRSSLLPTVEPPARTPPPMSGQATRLGYPRHVRTPTAGELAAVALPGVAGLLFLTFSGGFIGYRQANSVRFLRAQDAERFLR
jgi:hypothetical protein